MATALYSMDMPPRMARESTTASVVEALEEDSIEDDSLEDSLEEGAVVGIVEVEMSVDVVEDVAVDGTAVMGTTSTTVVHGGGDWFKYWAICRSLRRNPDFS